MMNGAGDYKSKQTVATLNDKNEKCDVTNANANANK